MPIALERKLTNLTPLEFDERDAIVMRCAYAAQNVLGRLCDERIYENDLARRLRAEGFRSVHTQVPATVSFDGFAKEHRFDLVADDALYELKTVSAFVPQHETQALHYAMLADVNHVKLLNFRPGKVQGKLLFNPLIGRKRWNIRWKTESWKPITTSCEMLNRQLRALLTDWGACLESKLYEEALVHFSGGETRCVQRVPLALDGIELGSHSVLSHAENVFFLVTAFSNAPETQSSHVRRLLGLTRLRAVQWINFDHTTVQQQTIEL